MTAVVGVPVPSNPFTAAAAPADAPVAETPLAEVPAPRSFPTVEGPPEDAVALMAGYGAALMPLRPASKKAAAKGWQHGQDPLSAERAIEELGKGFNLGVHCGMSGIIVLDAENQAARDLLMANGFWPTVIPAKAQLEYALDPAHDKRGGAHFWLQVPPGIDARTLHAKLSISLPNGGLLDILAGPRYAVAPPSRLGEAHGKAYAAASRGNLDPEVPIGPLPVAPLWLFQVSDEEREATRGADLAALVGALAPHAAVERGAEDAASMELTEAIDSISWPDWLDGDPRLAATGSVDSDCGCSEYHWGNSDHDKSATLHEGCNYGHGAHLWSGTMQADLGLGEHVSRLDLAAALRGGERTEVMREFGLITAESSAEFARKAEAEAFASSAAYFADVIMLPRQGTGSAPVTAVPGAGSAAGAAGGEGAIIDVEAEVLEGDAPAAGTAVAQEDAIEGELVEEGSDVEARARKIFRELRPAIAEIERQLRGGRDPKTGLWQGITPALGRIANQAESSGVFMHGLIGALLPRAVAGVPPYVVLPPRNGLRMHKLLGQGLNCYSVLLAPSSSGKGETDNAAEVSIPLPEGVAALLNGTAESWSKAFRGVHDGEPYIKTTSGLIAIDEVLAFNAELTRSGTKLPGWLASTWMNGLGGQGTSDEKNSAVMPKHGSRIGITVNAQPANMRILGDLNATGVGPRFAKALAGVVAKAERGQLYGLAVPPVMADQSLLPWYTARHVGAPPITAQQSPAWIAANAGVAPKFADMTGEELDRRGVEGFDDTPAFWIDLPQCALQDIEDGIEVAAARAADWGLAFDQDQDGSVSGHRVVLQQHVAAALTVMDAQTAITEAQWHAAGLFLAGSDLVMRAVNAYLEMTSEAEETNAGHLRGVGYAASKAAEVGVTTRNVQSAMRAIITRLQAAGGSAKPGYLKAGVKGKFSGMSPTQKRHAEQAFGVLERAGQVRLSLDGTWTLDGSLAITQKPAA